MKTRTISKVIMVLFAAAFVAGCYPTPGTGIQTFGTQPYPADLDDDQGGNHGH